MIALLLGVTCFAASQDVLPILAEGMLCHPTRLLVKTSPGRKPSLPGVKVIASLSLIRWSVVETKIGRLLETKRRLASLPGVEAVTLDRAAQPAYDPNDPLWPDMWHMTAIKANLAWDHSFGSPGVTVAVIDTGVMTTHPDLDDNIWHNPGEIPGNSIDDDGNGYVDDTVGYDFAYLDNDPDDVYGHGTACAGLVASEQDNFIGGTGVAPRAKIMCLKACIDSGYFYDSMTVPAYMYAAANGAKVLSMSYFSDRVSQAERDAIDYCWNHGVVPVAAAGNSSSVIPYYPAAYENTLSVAALGTNLLKAGFSNFGTWVDVSAPGVSLRTTTNSGGYTSGFGGTSGACPHVAGLAALLFGARPSATATEVRNAIEDTATNISQSPYGEFSNYGLVNSEAAVLAIMNGAAPPREPRVRYVTCLGTQIQDVVFRDDIVIRSRIYGRGLQSPRQVVVTMGGEVRPLAVQKRDYVEFVYSPPVSGSLRVDVDGQTLANFPMPGTLRRTYPFVEGSSPGATVVGGFTEALLPEGSNLSCSRRSDGIISLQATIRMVAIRDRARLRLRRSYTGSAAGTETVYLYDWQSGSYPYGNWVAIRSGPTPNTAQVVEIPLLNFAKFIDPEKTMYMLIQTTDNMPSASKLLLDQCVLLEVP